MRHGARSFPAPKAPPLVRRGPPASRLCKNRFRCLLLQTQRHEISAQRLDQPVCVAGTAGGPIDVEIRPHEDRVHSGSLEEARELAVRVDDGAGRAGLIGNRYDLSPASLDEGGRLRRHACPRR